MRKYREETEGQIDEANSEYSQEMEDQKDRPQSTKSKKMDKYKQQLKEIFKKQEKWKQIENKDDIQTNSTNILKISKWNI